MCLLGGAFLLGLAQQELNRKGKRCPGHETVGVPGGAEMLPDGRWFGPEELLLLAGGYAADATNGLAVPARDAAPPAVKAG